MKPQEMIDLFYANKHMYERLVRRMPKVGDKIRIICMDGEPQYTGREGTVTLIDDMKQIHGTWGGCALIPETDSWELIYE